MGLGLAMVMRIVLLLSLCVDDAADQPLFSVYWAGVFRTRPDPARRRAVPAGQDAYEIHNTLEGEEGQHGAPRPAAFYGTLVQIALLDIVFSLDSVITAVGMVDDIPVMVLAIVIAVVVMMFAARPIGDFVDRIPRSRCWP